MDIKYKYQWYQHIYECTPKILHAARNTGADLGLEPWKGRLGLYPGSSTCPGPLPGYVLDAIIRENKGPVRTMRRVEDELRNVVKDIYGDHYDAAVANTCEAALRITYETLLAPPILRKGDAYRARFIAPYAEDYEFFVGYGRPFPPMYKNLLGDRSPAAGELGVEAKSLNNLDAILVRLEGVDYAPHGIKFNPVPLMTRLDHVKSYQKIARVAERHASDLVGFVSVGYETPGYGGLDKDEKGVPRLMGLMGRLARDYDLPFIVDGAGSVPVFWPSLEDIGADIMVWSTDKAVRAPISGLIIGNEEIMVPVRKAMGLGGARYGEVSSHSKALFALNDPGRDAVVGLTAVLKMLRDQPDKIRRPIDQFHRIVEEEFALFSPHHLRDKLIIYKSYAYGGTEINYEQTWDGGRFGIPLFSAEDMFTNTNLIMSALDEMGLLPSTIYSGNIWLGPGLGTLDEDGELMEEPARLAVKALVAALEIVCRHAGLQE